MERYRGLGKVPGGTTDLSDPESEHESLGQYLVIEHKVIRVFFQRKSLQDFPAKGPKPGVILGELGPLKKILERGEEAVRNVLVQRHASSARRAPENARPEG